MSGGADRLKKKLSEWLETGAFILDPVSARVFIEEASLETERNEEFDLLLLELAAALAVVHPGSKPLLERLLSDPGRSAKSKTKSFSAVRSGLFESERAETALALSTLFLNHPEPGVRDLCIRSFLQTLTEMTLGGVMHASALKNREETKRCLTVILKKLRDENWLEAAELIDFLELDA